MVAAWSADHQHEHRTLSHDRQVRNPVYGQNLFRPYRNQQRRTPGSQPDPSAPTTTNVGAKYFSAESQPATPHTLFTIRPVSPNTTNQCTGEIFFARIANHHHRIPVRNPTRQPQHHLPTCGRNIFRPNRNQQHRIPIRNPTRQPPHHLPTCGRNIFRPYNILPICLIPVTTQPLCPTPPATVGARCAGVALPRPAQRTYLAKSI